MNEYVILVDENDNEVGGMEKLMVHRLGLLHRAFSVFLFNSKGELLLQQRADCKYHSAGLWSNTCCSHPNVSESTEDAVRRRLSDELGISCDVNFAFSFTYRAEMQNNLVEHEFDHVYFGFTDALPRPNPLEVKDWKYVAFEELQEDIHLHESRYTEWMKICLPKVIKNFRTNLSRA